MLPFGIPGSRGAARSTLLTSSFTAGSCQYAPLYAAGPRARRRRAEPVRRRRRARGLVPRARAASCTTSSRRVARDGAAARRASSTDEQARLLPALRRRDGADAPLARDPGARRRRLHERRYDEEADRWTVTDHNAHAWVEVWFHGWGWLPFDPTPGRGQLSGHVLDRRRRRFDVERRSRRARRRVGQRGRASELRRDLRRARLEGTGRRRAGRSPGAARSTGSATAATACCACWRSSRLVARSPRSRSRKLVRPPLALPDARSAPDRGRVPRASSPTSCADQGVDVPASATLAELGEAVGAQLGVDADALRRGRPGSRGSRRRRRRPRAAREARRELRRLRRTAARPA